MKIIYKLYQFTAILITLISLQLIKLKRKSVDEAEDKLFLAKLYHGIHAN